MIGVAGVDREGVEIEARQVVGDRLPGGTTVGALEVHIVSGDLHATLADANVHGIRPGDGGSLPAAPAVARLEQAAVVAEVEVRRIAGVECQGVDVGRPERRPRHRIAVGSPRPDNEQRRECDC